MTNYTEKQSSTIPFILYSPREICTILDISRSTLNLLITNGKIDSFKLGRSRKVSQQQLAAFIEKMQIGE